MEQLNNLDVIFLIIVGISALVGIARGMTKELLSVIGWVLAAAALFYLIPLINPYTKNYVASDLLASIVSGLGILLVFCIIWILTVDKLSALIRSSKLSALDRLFGFVFGTARGVLIVVLIALLVSTLMPEDSKKGVFEKSVLFAFIPIPTRMFSISPFTKVLFVSMPQSFLPSDTISFGHLISHGRYLESAL